MRVQETKTRKNATAAMLPMTAKTSMPSKTAGKSTSPSTRKPTTEEIATRAYYLYLERGGQHGCDQDDWYRAEQELMREMNKM
jgi:hypothetical protein